MDRQNVSERGTEFDVVVTYYSCLVFDEDDDPPCAAAVNTSNPIHVVYPISTHLRFSGT